jgi:hypothetical protein
MGDLLRAFPSRAGYLTMRWKRKKRLRLKPLLDQKPAIARFCALRELGAVF